jgi:hypothetical protein
MNKTPILAGACVALLAASAAQALEAQRIDLTGASGACVPTLPSDPVRYRVGGLRNAGNEDIYVICGMIGDWREGGTGVAGASDVYIRVTNTDAVERSTQCTLHAGYSSNSTSTTQGAFAQAKAIAPGMHWEFTFTAATVVDGDEWATATFICRLPPKSEISYVMREYSEWIGA